MILARRMQLLGTETAFEVLERAKALEAEGKDVVHLEIGEPDFDTPGHISRAAMQALSDGFTHYGPSAGQPDLRQAISRHLERTRGVDIDPDGVVVTPGAKPILFYSIMALAQPGDEVVYTDPGFPIYKSMIEFCGAKPVPLRFRVIDNRFVIDLEDLAPKLGDRTKLVIINFPQNPTGATVDGRQIEQLADLLRGTKAVVLSDEVYSEILYEGQHLSIAALPGFMERTILLDGFSKTYAMTGWRLGYGVFPEFMREHIIKLIVNSVSCAPTFVQKAAITALEGPHDDVKLMVEEFRRRRDTIVQGLRQIPGISCCMPGGAFYVFPSIQEVGIPSDTFADRCLQEAGVAILAGTAFGNYGEGFVRLSYANSMENLNKALERIESFVKNVKR